MILWTYPSGKPFPHFKLCIYSLITVVCILKNLQLFRKSTNFWPLASWVFKLSDKANISLHSSPSSPHASHLQLTCVHFLNFGKGLLMLQKTIRLWPVRVIYAPFGQNARNARLGAIWEPDHSPETRFLLCFPKGAQESSVFSKEPLYIQGGFFYCSFPKSSKSQII